MPRPPFQKVSAGDPIDFSAAEHNAFLDTVQTVRALRKQFWSQNKRDIRHGGVRRVFNDSGVDIPQFGLLSVSDSLFNPTTHLDAFTDECGLTGVIPNPDLYSNRWVVAQEPIRNGTVGFAVAWGMTIARIRSSADEITEDFANIVAGDYTDLVPAGVGAEIIISHRDAYDPTLWWSIVRLGAPPFNGRVSFRIVSYDEYTGIATCRVRSRPCGVTRVPGEVDGLIEVHDPDGCHFNEAAEALVDRPGRADYMVPDAAEDPYGACRWECSGLCCP